MNSNLNKKILVGVPRKDHVLLAYDEIHGLQALGYQCIPFKYLRSNQKISKLRKYIAVIIDTFKIIFLSYKHRPAFIYFNSRLDELASLRDAFVVWMIRVLYPLPLKILIKTHGSNPSMLDIRSFVYKNFVIPVLQKKVDAWFFLSSQEKEMIRIRNREMAEKIHITVNIVIPERSRSSKAFREKFNLPEDKLNVLFVSRMAREKGGFDVMQAIPDVKNKNRCFFTFVGDGPDLGELQNLAKELKLEKLVQFTGFIQDEECNHFYANTDLLVFPTYFDEGFPMVLFKSVAAGLPVITTRTRAAIDFLSEPDHLLWVEARSPQQVAQAIDRLVEDDLLREKMSQNNILLGRKFNQSDVCNGMMEVFESVR